MAQKVNVIIEEDEHGFYAWCPELKCCQTQGESVEEALAKIKEAIELYLETLPDKSDLILSRQVLTTTVEVNA